MRPLGLWLRGKIWRGWVVLRDGRVQKSFDTEDLATATSIKNMLGLLRAQRQWDLLDAVVSKAGRLTVGELYDQWLKGDDGIEALRARLADVDLNDYVAGWQRWALANADAESVDKYEKQLRVLIPEGVPFMRSAFDSAKVSEALHALEVSNSTKRRYAAAWQSFGKYLVERQVIASNPLKAITKPRNNKLKEKWLELADVKRYVAAQPMPYQSLAALREGAGVEISAALAVTRRDVYVDRQVVHVHGTKNERRDRMVLVDDWAWPIFVKAMKGKHDDALLFDGVTEDSARHQHRKALKAVGLRRDYTMHNARHSFAVRWMKAGANPQDIANNLGHCNASQVVTRYGKYRVTLSDLAETRRHLRLAR